MTLSLSDICDYKSIHCIKELILLCQLFVFEISAQLVGKYTEVNIVISFDPVTPACQRFAIINTINCNKELTPLQKRALLIMHIFLIQ